MIRIVAIRQVGGRFHEHISELRWTQDEITTTDSTRAQMVAFVEGGGEAYVKDARGDVAFLRVRTSVNGIKYVQTYADGIWSDNLLALPRF